MLASAIKTMAEEILGGDTIDETFFLNVLNSVKDRLEDERPWMYLRKLNSSLTASVGNNYSTSKALPTDWRRTYKMLVGTDLLLVQKPFDEQHIYRNHSGYFVIDVANSVYYILGNISRADTIYHYYIRTTPELTISDSPVFPERFHKLLAFEVAGYIQLGQDADDIFARMAPENKAQAIAIKNSMLSWDNQLQGDAQNNQLQVADAQPTWDLGKL